MLRTMPSLSLLEREIRLRVCPRCHLRPPHSESLGPEAVRACEMSCLVFTHLPMLRKTAILTDPMLRSRADALRRRIHEICQADPCGSNAVDGGTSPLNRYRGPIIKSVLKLVGEN